MKKIFFTLSYYNIRNTQKNYTKLYLKLETKTIRFF